MQELPFDIDLTNLIPLGLEMFFYFICLVYLIYSLFLAYHWFSYGTSTGTNVLAFIIYLVGGVPFLLTMFFIAIV